MLCGEGGKTCKNNEDLFDSVRVGLQPCNKGGQERDLRAMRTSIDATYPHPKCTANHSADRLGSQSLYYVWAQCTARYKPCRQARWGVRRPLFGEHRGEISSLCRSSRCKYIRMQTFRHYTRCAFTHTHAITHDVSLDIHTRSAYCHAHHSNIHICAHKSDPSLRSMAQRWSYSATYLEK